MMILNRWTSRLVRAGLVGTVFVCFGTVHLVAGQVEIGPRSKPAPRKSSKGAPKPIVRPAPTQRAAGVPTIEVVLIPAGTFMMGSTDQYSRSAKPIHQVTISRPYYLGKYEVTQEQWTAVMGSNPSIFKGSHMPVENVSWDDVQEFLRLLNMNGGGWRLPTEAEWEYACRAGTTGDFAGVIEEMAWYGDNSGGITHPVGQKRPNGWGLYDMHGNVWEWCNDWFDENYYSQSPGTDPAGPHMGQYRVARGGGWTYGRNSVRSAERISNDQGFRDLTIGFRVARTP